MVAKLALVGACHDLNSSFMRGPADAPDQIRRVLHNGAANLTSEAGFALDAAGALRDFGNLPAVETEEGVMAFADGLTPILRDGYRPITLGGDHAVTFPLVQAVHAHHGMLDILHFDAHSDTYPSFDDNPYSHASPFARIVERGLAGRLVQIGIRTMTRVVRDFVSMHGVEVHEWRGQLPSLPLRFERPTYISIDIDALDPAFAPGVSHHEPGGMSTRDVLDVLQSLQANVVAADVVEYNPSRDTHDMTAMVCAKFVKELASILCRDNATK